MQIKAVAKLANVSSSTVSRVVNDSKAVSPELKQKVLDAIESLDYSASHAAKSLKGGRSYCIAIVITSIERIFFTEIIKEITHLCHQKNYMVQICETYDNPDLEIQIVKNLRLQWVDGIILVSSVMDTNPRFQKYIQSLSNLRKKDMTIPVILLETPSQNKKVSSVSTDHFAAAYKATKHLFTIGKKHIIHIACPKESPVAEDRINGYTNACIDIGLTSSNFQIIHGDFTVQSGYEIVNNLVQKRVHFDGIFAGNDQMAVGALRACKELGLTIPNEVAIIGYDNILLSLLVEPSLSTVNISQKKIGKLASNKLFELIECNLDQQVENIVVDAELIIRESTIGSL
ncbi:MAG: LacI family DNA-binding transcriptional regulator [Brevinema sp.]